MNKFGSVILAAGAALVFALPVYPQYAEITLAGESGAQTAARPRVQAGVLTASAKPVVIQPSIPSPAALSESEWDFLSSRGEEKDKDLLELLLPQVSDWIAVSPAGKHSADAQLLKAALQLKLGDYKSGIMSLIRHFYEYPQADSSAAAKQLFTETVDKKAGKEIRPVLSELAAAHETGETSVRLAMMLQKVCSRAGEFLYEPVQAEYRDFFRRFPDRPGNDMLRLALADLHRGNRDYLPAKIAYEKMIQLHPASPLLPVAKSSLGKVLADNLKEYGKAIEVYRDITVSFPGNDQAWVAYTRLPALAERTRQYELSVRIYEQIIELYPDRSEAYDSYNSEARVLRKKLGKSADAVEVLIRLADRYKDRKEKALKALLLAAEIYRKDLKDAAGEVKMYDRIAGDYPSDAQAPKALYAAAQIYFKQKDTEKAGLYYRKLLTGYPENPLSAKAQKKLAAIITGKN